MIALIVTCLCISAALALCLGGICAMSRKDEVDGSLRELRNRRTRR